MYPVKQSTALTIPVFGHDANGDAVTGMVDGGFTKRISKNGGAFGAMTVTITEMENGWYSVPLSTAHTDTLGVLSLTFTNASCKQINIQLRVHARLADDLAFPTTSGRSLDVTATGAAGIDWGNVENQATSVDLSATSTNLVDTASVVTGHTPQTGDGYAEVTNVTYGLAQLVRSTTPANTLDVAVGGQAGVDLDNSVGTLAKTTDITGFNDIAATDVVSSGAITTLAGAVVNVDTVDTCTTNTDMRGTDSALLAASAPTNFGDLAITVTTGRVDVNVNNDKTGYSIADATSDAVIADAVWNAATATYGTAGTYGEAVEAIDTSNLDAAVSTRATPAQVNAEVVDALNVDTYAEPGQGLPPATTTLVQKIGYLFKAWRNRTTVTATTVSLYNDAASVVDQKSTHSDDTTTYDRGEIASGP